MNKISRSFKMTRYILLEMAKSATPPTFENRNVLFAKGLRFSLLRGGGGGVPRKDSYPRAL